MPRLRIIPGLLRNTRQPAESSSRVAPGSQAASRVIVPGLVADAPTPDRYPGFVPGSWRSRWWFSAQLGIVSRPRVVVPGLPGISGVHVGRPGARWDRVETPSRRPGLVPRAQAASRRDRSSGRLQFVRNNGNRCRLWIRGWPFEKCQSLCLACDAWRTRSSITTTTTWSSRSIAFSTP